MIDSDTKIIEVDLTELVSQPEHYVLFLDRVPTDKEMKDAFNDGTYTIISLIDDMTEFSKFVKQ